MRRFFVLLSVLGGVVLGSSTPASAQFVAGGGINGFGDTFDLVAGQLPDGTAAGQAHFVLRFSPDDVLRLTVEIDCLRVFGDKANISGVVTRSNDPGAIGVQILFAVREDGATIGPFAVPPFVDCDNAGEPPDSLFVPIRYGNIVVSA